MSLVENMGNGVHEAMQHIKAAPVEELAGKVGGVLLTRDSNPDNDVFNIIQQQVGSRAEQTKRVIFPLCVATSHELVHGCEILDTVIGGDAEPSPLLTEAREHTINALQHNKKAADTIRELDGVTNDIQGLIQALKVNMGKYTALHGQLTVETELTVESRADALRKARRYLGGIGLG